MMSCLPRLPNIAMVQFRVDEQPVPFRIWIEPELECHGCNRDCLWCATALIKSWEAIHRVPWQYMCNFEIMARKRIVFKFQRERLGKSI
jgi:hypothetical protein